MISIAGSALAQYYPGYPGSVGGGYASGGYIGPAYPGTGYASAGYAPTFLSGNSNGNSPGFSNPGGNGGFRDGYRNGYGIGYNSGSTGEIIGGAALIGTDTVAAAQLQSGAQSRQYGQQAEANQDSMVQNGVRSLLTSQAVSRANTLNGQQQSNQQWWLDQQAMQLEKEREAFYARPAPASPKTAPTKPNPDDEQNLDERPSAPGQPASDDTATNRGKSPAIANAAIHKAVPRPAGKHKVAPAATDVIQWPTALEAESFASERAKIEAPYRRTPHKLSEPSMADYQKMLPVIDNMQAMLDWQLKEGLRTNDYNAAVAFLSEMSREASGRVDLAMHANNDTKLR